MNVKHNAPMNIDHEIDAALNMLNEAQPSAAMVSRVHAKLALAANSEKVRRVRWFWGPVAGVAVAAVLIAVVSLAHWTQGKPRPAVETAKTIAMDSASPRIARVARPELAPKRSQEAKVSMRKSHHRRQRSRDRHVANLFDYPLTKQEKLLVRFAQTASPAELQMLNPEHQAKIEAQQKAEFEAYLKSGEVSNMQGTAN